MQYKLIIVDIDGTLIPAGEYPIVSIPKELKELIKSLEKIGIKFSLASARSLTGMSNLPKALDLTTPVILDNGAKIYDFKHQKYIFKSFLSKSKAEEIISFLKSKSYKIAVMDDERRLTDFREIKKWKIYKIVVSNLNTYQAKDLYEELMQYRFISVTRSISSGSSLLEAIHITKLGVNKKSALLKLTGYLKVLPSEIIGIGDSDNDLEFLKICGWKLAVENATPSIKDIADLIIPSVDKNGVVSFLKNYMSNYPTFFS